MVEGRKAGREREREVSFVDSFSYSCSCSDCIGFHKLKPGVVEGGKEEGWEGMKREREGG